MKRVNFNMNAECHALLKGVSALKGKNFGEYCYEIITEEFYRLVREDDQVQSMFLAGTYIEGGAAYRLKELLKEELNSANDSSAWSLCNDW